MHRFGRSAQQKMKDRWGGSFILATILALVGAYLAGNWIEENWRGGAATNTNQQPGVVQGPGTQSGAGMSNVVLSGDSKLYMVRVGAYKSDTNVRTMIHTLTEKGYIGLASAKDSSGLTRVYAGLYTSQTAANEAKTKLLADGLVKDVGVDNKTLAMSADAVPVAAMNVKGAPDLKKGMEAMNAYVLEVAAWVESGAGVDTAAITNRGKELSKFAADLSKVAGQNASLQPLAELATRASTNATEMQTAAKAGPGSTDFQMAMNNYFTLLDQYNHLRQPAANTP